jgi:hypothetical protein
MIGLMGNMALRAGVLVVVIDRHDLALVHGPGRVRGVATQANGGIHLGEADVGIA